MRQQGLNCNGEPLRSVYVEHEAQPAPWLDDGRTRQEFADDCDINILLERYEKTGVINHFNPKSPQYLDVTDVPDLVHAMNVLDAGTAAFMQLPAIVRREFDNDPVKFLDYCADKNNIDQLREWGLAPPIPSTHATDTSPPQGGSGTPPETSPAGS